MAVVPNISLQAIGIIFGIYIIAHGIALGIWIILSSVNVISISISVRKGVPNWYLWLNPKFN